MIDFIKVCLDINELKTKLKKDNRLNFKTNFTESTGEITSSIAYYKGMKFIYTRDRFYLSGSLHKFYNDGKINYNDFSLLELIQTFRILYEEFNLPIDKMRIINLEIGVNIPPPINTDKILRNLFYHKGQEFKNTSVKNGEYQQCNHQQFDLKVYNKAKQENLNQELLRIEIKYKKSKPLKRLGITTMLDLLKPEVFNWLGRELFQNWSKVLLIDPTIKGDLLEPKEKEKIIKWSNRNYWIELKTENKNKNAFNREVNRYKKVVENHSDQIQDQIFNSILNKWGKLTDFSKMEIIYMVRKINQSYIKLIFPDYKNVCPVTKLDISMQKENSSFLCTSGLMFYKKNKPDLYNQIINKYLLPKHSNKPEKTKIEIVAHNIRNDFHNLRRDFRNLMNPEKPKLFNTLPYIEKEKLKDFGLTSKSLYHEFKHS